MGGSRFSIELCFVEGGVAVEGGVGVGVLFVLFVWLFLLFPLFLLLPMFSFVLPDIKRVKTDTPCLDAIVCILVFIVFKPYPTQTTTMV